MKAQMLKSFGGPNAFELSEVAKPVPQADASGVSNNIWDYLLKSYVAAGLVDYK